MSQQSAAEFIQKVQTDDSLRADVIALGQNMDGLVALGAQHGYSFSAADLQAAISASGHNTAETELSEDQLAAVAGGVSTEHQLWTGCAYGQSGCTWTHGCEQDPNGF